MNYKILDYKYTAPVPLMLSGMVGIGYFAIITVVIETGVGGWKAYQGVFPYADKFDCTPGVLQGIAARGLKLQDNIAIAMFPKFKPELYNQ